MPKPVGRQTVEITVNVENEQLVLATMMNDRVALIELTRTLDRDVFLGKRHRVIFGVLDEIAARNLVYDAELFQQIARNKDYGGRVYLDKLTTAYSDKPKNLNYHVDKLRGDAVKHSLRVGPVQRLVDLCEDPAADLDTVSGEVRELNHKVVGHLTGGVSRGDPLYQKYLTDLRARRKSSLFVPTGFTWLDENLTEGLAHGKVSIVTARPNIGKSTFAWNVGDRVANKFGIPVLYVPLEMGTISVMDGMVAARSGIHLDTLIKFPHRMTPKQAKLVNQTAWDLTTNKNLTFFDGRMTLNDIYRVVSEGGYRLAIFDLWEKLAESLEANEIAKALNFTQQLSKDCKCHFMLVHQTKRGVDKRDDPMPTMDDLKNSGGYEEVADLIIGMTRRKFYQPDLDEDVAEFAILKQRRGPRQGRVYYNFEGHVGRIGEERRDFRFAV